MFPNQQIVDAACDGAVANYRQRMRDELAATGQYMNIPWTAIECQSGALEGRAINYDGPRGKGVQAEFRYTESGGVQWLKCVNFGPETYRDRGWGRVMNMAE